MLHWKEELHLYRSFLKGETTKAQYHTRSTKYPTYISFYASTRSTSSIDGELQKLSEDLSEKHKENFAEASAGIEADKSLMSNQNSAVDRLNRRRNEMKKKSDDAIDKTFDSAIDEIDNLPPGEQEVATNGFLLGMDAVANFFDFILGQFGQFFNHIVDFISGIFTKVKEAVVHVAKEIGSVFKRLGSIFKH